MSDGFADGDPHRYEYLILGLLVGFLIGVVVAGASGGMGCTEAMCL